MVEWDVSADVQFLLKWCEFDEPIVDSYLHSNKSRKYCYIMFLATAYNTHYVLLVRPGLVKRKGGRRDEAPALQLQSSS